MKTFETPVIEVITFTVADMQISGEFNFVYCNERVAKEKIDLLF